MTNKPLAVVDEQDATSMSNKPGNQDGSILEETCDSIRFILGDEIEELKVERVVLGLFFTGVKLSNGAGGISATPIKMIPEAVCCPSSARAMPDSGRMKEKSIRRFMDYVFSQNPLKKCVAVAVLNALSQTCGKKNPLPGYELVHDADPLDFLTIPAGSYTLVAGALLPYIKMLKKNDLSYGILELDPATLRVEELPFFVNGRQKDEALARADYLLVTGTTLLNDTLEGLLSRRKDGAEVVLVGPTASLYPAAFFEHGITSVGGITVTDADGMLDVLAEGGSGYHFFGKYAEKTVIKRK